MKTKILSIILLCFFTSTFCQIVTIPDYEFKQALLNYSPTIDINNDNEIQFTEALAVTTLNISGYQEFIINDPMNPLGGSSSQGISDFTGIEAFTNLTSLICSQNDLNNLDVSALTQLTYLDCSNNINQFGTTSNASGIKTLTLPNSASLETLICKENYITSIDVSNKTLLTVINASSNSLTNLNLTNTPALESLNVNSNYSLGSIDASNHSALNSILSENCALTTLNIQNTPQLETLKCKQNQLSSLDVSTSIALETLEVHQNNIISLDLTNNTNLITVTCNNNLLASLLIPNTSSLKTLLCYSNKLTNLNASMATGLITLNSNLNLLTNLILPATNSLKTIETSSNKLTTLNTSNTNGLTSLKANNNLLNNLILPNSTTLQNLEAFNNQLTNINVNQQSNLTALDVNNNLLSLLNISANLNLQSLHCANNQLTSLNTLSNTSLNSIECSGNLITALDTTTMNTLSSLSCSNNLLTELDLSSFTNLTKIYCSNNLLTKLNLKNGNSNSLRYFTNPFAGTSTFNAKNNTNLNAICVDDALIAAGNLTNGIDTHTNFTEYCSFAPANSNTIIGTVSYDFNNNGCDAADTKSVNTRINSVSSNLSASSFSASDGTYTIYINDTNVNTEIIPNFPSFFSVSPTSQSTTFNGSGNTENINFCITANSQVNDVTVTAFTTRESRPGFNTVLRIFYKNNGSTIISSGTVKLNFNEQIETFNNASINPDAQTNNSLSWDYLNLLPFEEKYIDVNFTINTPIHPTNPVNGGDTISYTTTITPLTGDATPTDNTNIFTDIIVNAYDPNDVTCFEGDKINTMQIPNDLTYRIRFQNTGSASAINIVVKEIIDQDLDVNTFIPIAASHNYRIALKETNKLEFIFENIQLADSTTNEPDSHGWIFYKIKPKSTAVIGDAFKTTANIYFDYNAPVITNTAITTVSATTSIPDTNFEQALIDLGHDAGPIDGLVFTSNVSNLLSLNVSNKNISDLTGIEDFVALTELNCSQNQLTTLNLNSNIALVTLLSNNNQLTSLDVSNNVLLENLHIQFNNITAIDLSLNTVIKSVRCNNNSITNLDLSLHTQLNNLICNNNLLTRLNIINGNNSNITTANFNTTNNPNLTCIEVDDISYAVSNFTNIDSIVNFVNSQAECTALNTSKVKTEKFLIFPNPAKKYVTIFTEIDAINILFDISGKEIKRFHITNGDNKINISDLHKGIYILKTIGVNINKTSKIIIE